MTGIEPASSRSQTARLSTSASSRKSSILQRRRDGAPRFGFYAFPWLVPSPRRIHRSRANDVAAVECEGIEPSAGGRRHILLPLARRGIRTHTVAQITPWCLGAVTPLGTNWSQRSETKHPSSTLRGSARLQTSVHGFESRLSSALSAWIANPFLSYAAVHAGGLEPPSSSLSQRRSGR